MNFGAEIGRINYMRKFLKENWFKIGIIILLLIIISLLYQFLVVQPRQEREEKKIFELNKKTEDEIAQCKKYGDQYYQNEINKQRISKTENQILTHEYHFNKKLNACFYLARNVINEIGYNKYILNLLTNEIVIDNTVFNDGSLLPGSSSDEEFNKKKKELFEEK